MSISNIIIIFFKILFGQIRQFLNIFRGYFNSVFVIMIFINKRCNFITGIFSFSID